MSASRAGLSFSLLSSSISPSAFRSDSGKHSAAWTLASACALAVWWSAYAVGSGTITAGSAFAVTSGRPLFAHTYNSAPHDWLQISGGAIGHGFPCATGAAIACPDRKVVCLEADGAGMYTLQSLWTQAREKLDVVNVVFANGIYKILQGELVAVGAKPGPVSNDILDLRRPDIEWVSLAKGMGVEAKTVDTLEGFADVFKSACSRRGPFLIEFRI